MVLIMDAAITQLVELALDKVISYLQNGVGFLLGEKDDLEKIKSSLNSIRSVIESAEEHIWKDQELVDWLGKLKDAAYDAEDILDEDAYNSNSMQDPAMNKVQKIASSFSKYPNRTKMTLKLKEIRKRLESIEEERHKFQLSEGVKKWEDEFKEHRQTHSSVDESLVYGRDEDKEKIVNLLLHPVAGHEDEKVSVIPIVGMGGLGKTTLAQLVFNDDRVQKQNHFKLKMWICVSDDFDVRKLVEKIIGRATGSYSTSDHLDLEALKRPLQEALNERRFLLVLDDVWNDNKEKWNKFRVLLMCGGSGSRVVVTTRDPRIASMISKIEPHRLVGLSDELCWKLFASRAFSDDREGDHPKLVEIGKNIVSKCKGVPLAVITLGNLLFDKKEERRWEVVRDSELWNLADDDVHAILPALRLSYYHLKPQHRQCFAFCAIFPKDYCMDKELLIQLWMAHGCVSSERGMELEDIGIEILNELLMRSLFQEAKDDEEEDDDGDEGSLKIKVHDLVHDLAQSVMGNDCCIIEPCKSGNFTKKVRHLSYFQMSETLPNFLYEACESLRTFLVLQNRYYDVPQDMEVFKFLRVLHLGAACNKQALLTSLGELIHLRYLGLFRTTRVKTLPESMGNLLNLQTLNLFGCSKLQELPKATRNLINLRCLDMTHCDSLSHMPAKIGMFSCLRKLPLFVVGDNAGDCSGIEELRSLNWLEGNLMIKHLERVAIPSNAQQALIRKPNLDSLQLSWFIHRFDDNGNNTLNIEAEEEVLEGLQPHENLKKLKINGHGGIRFPKWMMGSSLPNIVTITLEDCRCEILPPLGELPSLKFLCIVRMGRVENIGSEFYGNDMLEAFPSLEELQIASMPSLKVWSGLEGKPVFPCLQILTILKCTNLKSLTEGIQNVSSLEELYLADVGLTSLPESLQKLSTLEKLSLLECSQLSSLPEGIGNLSSLKELLLIHVGLTSLPESMQELSTLRKLCIQSCPQLPSLPEGIGNLTALQFLSIHNCPHMVSLPLGLQRLTGLQILKIIGCPELQRRCEETGEDYHKIRHIPEVKFQWW